MPLIIDYSSRLRTTLKRWNLKHFLHRTPPLIVRATSKPGVKKYVPMRNIVSA